MKTLPAWASRLFLPVDIAPLVFIRVGFGALMLWEVWRYFHYDRIGRYFVDTAYNFHYYGFEWVKPLPGDGMYALFHALGLLSLLILVGALYRLSMALFCVMFTYVFLLDQAQYLNHFYLICLVSLLMVFVPAHRALSVDAALGLARPAHTAPAWALWLLRGQMAIVYFFGGVAKINEDWLAGEPLRTWMAARTDFVFIGQWFTEEWMVMLFTWGGLLLDLFIVPFLLWRRTRVPALLLAITFHLMNSQLFNIGIFPWFAIAMTLIFMPPAWFRPPFWRALPAASPAPPPPQRQQRLVLGLLAAYFAVQVALPLRHFFIGGNPSWTEAGHTLAWHMRLRAKEGDIAFFATDPLTGTTWPVDTAALLSDRQHDQMKDNPQMILRFAHYLARRLRADGLGTVQVRAWAMMSLNRRAPQLLIDPTTDLAQQPDQLGLADWVLPLVQRPAPQPAVPAVLLSDLGGGVLLLINMTMADAPLAGLRLAQGDTVWSPQAWGYEVLEPAECLLIHHPEADLARAWVPCNEAGRVAADLRADQPVQALTAAPLACASPRCVVSLPQG